MPNTLTPAPAPAPALSPPKTNSDIDDVFKKPPLEVFSEDRGPIRSLKTRSNKAESWFEASILGYTYPFRTTSLSETIHSYEKVLEYVLNFGHSLNLKTVDIDLYGFRKTIFDLKNDLKEHQKKLLARKPHFPEISTKFPGIRKVDLEEFLRTHYKEHIKMGVELSWFRTRDPALYKAIENHKKRHGPLSPDVAIPSQREALAAVINKLYAAGPAALTSEEKMRIGRCYQRVNGISSPQR